MYRREWWNLYIHKAIFYLNNDNALIISENKWYKMNTVKSRLSGVSVTDIVLILL